MEEGANPRSGVSSLEDFIGSVLEVLEALLSITSDLFFFFNLEI